MQAPVVFLDRVVFPGIYDDIRVTNALAADIERLWAAEGFGCVECALAFPADPTRPASAANFAPLGVLAELTVQREDLAAGRAQVRVQVGESERVRLGALVTASGPRAATWPHPLAELEAAPLEDDQLSEADLDRVRRKLTALLLEHPAAFAEQVQPAALIADAWRGDVPPWRLVNLWAESILNKYSDRAAALGAARAADVLAAVEGALAGFGGAAAQAPAHAIEALLAEAAEEQLGGALDAIEATLAVGGAGLVEVPPPLAKELRRISKELTRLHERLLDLTEAWAEHHAPQRDDAEEDEDDEP